MKLPAYQRNKPSGVDWLGEVPEHWKVKRIKWSVMGCINGIWGDEPNGVDDIICVRVADFDRDNLLVINAPPTLRAVELVQREGRKLKRGDLLIEKSGGGENQLVGCVVYFDHWFEAVCSNFVARMPIVSGFSPRYWCYVHAAIYSGKLNYPVIKQTTGIQNLDSGAYLDISAPYPPPPEQQAIAEWLDRETGRIQELVARKQELIERLNEKRTALISRTVTRGLPPAAAGAANLPENPTLRPSGIDWLGDIPSHWEAVQLRRKAQILDCKHRTVPFIDDGIPVASIREVHGFEVDLTTAKQTSEEEYLALIEGDRRPRVGDIIYSRNATVGDAALVTTTERFCMGQDVCMIRAPKQVPKFFLYLFRSAPLMEQVESLMIGSTFRRINVGQIHAFWICVPPILEQVAIAKYLDVETAKLDALVGEVETAIERLQEYRIALITAAVTGKIDVRKTNV